MEVPGRAELRKLKVVELRQRLSKLSLPQGGIKEDLITRLIKHYEKLRDEEISSNNLEQEDTPTEETASNQPPTVKEVEVTPTLPKDPALTMPTKEGVVPPSEPTVDVEINKVVNEVKEKQLADEKVMEADDKEDRVKNEEVRMETEEPASEDTGIESTGEDIEAVVKEDVGVENTSGDSGTENREAITEEDGVENKEASIEKKLESEPFSEIAADKNIELENKEASGKEIGSREPSGEEVRIQKEGTEVASEVQLTQIKHFNEEMRADKETAREDVGVMQKRRWEDSEPMNHVQNGGRMASEEEPMVIQNEPEEVTKGGKKKKKKKRRRRRHDQSVEVKQELPAKESDVEIEYIQEDILKPGDPNYRQFHRIFEAFKISEPPEAPNGDNSMSVSQLVAQAALKSKQLALQQDSSSDEEEKRKEKEQKMSKKKLRKLNRLSVAQLKQLVDRPDVVEMHDVTATDPKLLIHLKSTRNTVPVPRHWCYKRKYLQGKRGIEKPPFDLPDFIKATGVMEMRQALEDKEDAKSLKQKTRERVRPKMGKLMIDYQKLHDAFFKWQTKPKMSIHGDMYYEGKEFETRLRQKKPGDLSDELRRALGMPTGLGKQKFPPPWLVAMQRYGPPPSYPNLKIPGLNAPIPENCSFGYFVGGWGKPPVDEIGRPLYGDVFGLEQQESGRPRVQVEEEIDKTLWGELESEEEEEEEEEESEDEEEAPKPEDIAAGLVTPMEGLVTPSGLTSIPAGMETPDMIQLRKKKIEEAMEQGGETPALYTVLPEKAASVGGAVMGSSHVYDVAASGSGPIKKANTVEVALDPSELDLDTATITARYEEQVREKRNMIQKEDLSDMVAEHAARQQKKRKRATTDTAAGGKAAKKLKEFKF